jgi:hypothetical protein
MNFLKSSQNPDAADCMRCTLQSKLDFFSYTFPVQLNCKHSKYQFSPTPRVRTVKTAQILGWVIQLTVFICLVVSCLHESSLCQNETSSCLIFISDGLFIVGSLAVMFIILLKVGTLHQEMASWLHICENREFYRLGRIIQGSDVNKFKRFRIASDLHLLIHVFVYAMYLYFSPSDSPWSLARKLAICSCYSMQARGVVELFKRISFIGSIFKAFEKSLETVLTTSPQNRSLTDIFRRYQSFVQVINVNLAFFMKTMAPLLCLWSLSSTVSLILNVYILIKYTNYNVQSMIWVQFRLIFVIVGIVTILIAAEDCLKRKVSFISLDSLEFIFYHPKYQSLQRR